MKYLVFIVVIFSFGALVGGKVASPEVEFVEGRTKVERVEVPGETITETVSPQACLDAMRYAVNIAEQSEEFYDKGTQQLDILSEGRKALAGGQDTSGVNNRQTRLSSSLNGNLNDLEEAYYNFDKVSKECK